MMNQKTVYIHTLGCQMNVYDSDRITAGLKGIGYRSVSSAEAADLVIINTCAIRAKAEQKLYSLVGRLAELKKKKPAMRIGIGGCVAQQEGEKLLSRAPCIDFVFGTHAVGRLTDLVVQTETSGRRIVDVRMSDSPDEDFRNPVWDTGYSQVSRFVTIMTGCDNHCTYCVVPHVRGPEMSRNPSKVLEEIRMLAGTGVREVTLLGQNVNSYGIKEGWCDFPDLLEQIRGVDGILRIRFTTSHPKDLSDKLILAFRESDKLAHHIHLPVQSGSDRILRRMNRRYNRRDYLDRVQRLRESCPDVAVTSDFIVGFPGESEPDFQETLDLIRTVEFDSVFAFKYSDRPSAPASRFPDKVAESIKSDRLARLLEIQKTNTQKRLQARVGTEQEILVEGRSPRSLESDSIWIQWTGRTSSNHIVHFFPPDKENEQKTNLVGALKRVRITRSFSHSLWGELLPDDS